MSQKVLNIPSFGDSAETWENWFDDLKGTFGKSDAQVLFTKAWSSSGNMKNAPANTESFRDNMEKQGIKLDGSWASEIAGVGYDLVGEFGDFFKVGKILGIGLAAVTVISVGGLIFQIAFRSSVRKQAIGVTKTFATKGMV